MTGDERFPEPGPVAEYRDPELVRRFESQPVPQHGVGFWTDLEARLGGGESPIGVPAPAADPVALVEPPVAESRWGTGRWLAVAAALVVLGAGGSVLLAQERSSSPVQSAAPTPDSAPGSEVDDGSDPGPSSTATTIASTTTATSTSASSGGSSTALAAVDYFDTAVRVDRVGPGRVAAFSPDDSAVLVVDDAPGVAVGCEGEELLTLYTQDLATGGRRPAIDGDSTVETGGLDLAVSPFGTTPSEVGTRPVYGTEWCDGQQGPVWRGVMAADGRISMIEPVAAGGPDDPFTAERAAIEIGDGAPSPDGEHLLVVDEATVAVVEAGPGADRGADGPLVAALPTGVAAGKFGIARWSPTGDAVALGSDGSVVLWSPWTGATQRFESGSVVDLLFDNAGGRLAVVAWDDGLTTSVLTFGDRPEPVSAPPRCSGRIALAPLEAGTLEDQGLPPAVVATVLAIDEAGAVCDWEALDRLVPDGFVASLGGGDAVTTWREEEGYGRSPMWYLRALLRQPHAVDEGAEPVLHVWPALHLKRDCRYDGAERETLASLGYDPDLAEEGCVVIGGYAGYRTAVDVEGRWRLFLAGD